MIERIAAETTENRATRATTIVADGLGEMRMRFGVVLWYWWGSGCHDVVFCAGEYLDGEPCAGLGMTPGEMTGEIDTEDGPGTLGGGCVHGIEIVVGAGKWGWVLCLPGENSGWDQDSKWVSRCT